MRKLALGVLAVLVIAAAVIAARGGGLLAVSAEQAQYEEWIDAHPALAEAMSPEGQARLYESMRYGKQFQIQRPTHLDSQANAACDWVEVRVWGAPNNVIQLKNAAVHLWGSHQADCVFRDLNLNSANHWCVLVDLITGYEAWWALNCLA